MLADLARGAGDLLDRTGTEAGAVMKSKKGDFVLTLDARIARGCDVRVVIEAKDRPMSMRAMREELREARENRGAAVALVVFTPAHAPSGVAPFNIVGDDVYCVIDPDDPDPATLEAAVRLARLLALASLVEREVEVDAAAIGAALTAIREQLEVVRTLKAQLTSIINSTKAVWTGLDTMRASILARVERRRDSPEAVAAPDQAHEGPETVPATRRDQRVGHLSPRGQAQDGRSHRIIAALSLAILLGLPAALPATAADPVGDPIAGRDDRRWRPRRDRSLHRHAAQRRGYRGRGRQGPQARWRQGGPQLRPGHARLLGQARQEAEERPPGRPERRRRRPGRHHRDAAQTTPTGVARVGGALSKIAEINGTDQRVDADVAIVDTGITPVPGPQRRGRPQLLDLGPERLA